MRFTAQIEQVRKEKEKLSKKLEDLKSNHADLQTKVQTMKKELRDTKHTSLCETRKRERRDKTVANLKSMLSELKQQNSDLKKKVQELTLANESTPDITFFVMKN